MALPYNLIWGEERRPAGPRRSDGMRDLGSDATGAYSQAVRSRPTEGEMVMVPIYSRLFAPLVFN